MKTNIGTFDRVVRVIFGTSLLALFLLGDGPVRWVGLIGVVPLLTALMGFCPLYAVLGISTRRRTAS